MKLGLSILVGCICTWGQGIVPVPSLQVGASAVINNVSFGTSTSGANVTLTPSWTCPTGDTCSGSVGSGPTGQTSPVVVTSGLAFTVNPTIGTEYTLTVTDTTISAVAYAYGQVYVGSNGLSITVSGCSGTVPYYSSCLVTVTYSGASCGAYSFLPNSGLTSCSGGTLSDPWEDAKGRIIFTGQTSGNKIAVDMYYYGKGNTWLGKFSPPIAVANGDSTGWNFAGTFGTFVGGSTDYINFSGSLSVAASNSKGPIRVTSNSPVLTTEVDGLRATLVGTNQMTSGPGTTGNDILIQYTYQSTTQLTGGISAFAYWSRYGFNFYRQNLDASESVINVSSTPLAINATGGYNYYSTGANIGVLSWNQDSGYQMSSITDDYVCNDLRANGFHYQLIPFDPTGAAAWGTVGSISMTANPTLSKKIFDIYRYSIARYDTCVDVYEMANEVTTMPVAAMKSWSGYIHQHSPYGRYTAISNINAGQLTSGIDFYGAHEYISGDSSPVPPTVALASNLASVVASWASATSSNVPLQSGETGNGSPYDADDSPDQIRARIFEYVEASYNSSPAFYSSSGSGPSGCNPSCAAITNMNLNEAVHLQTAIFQQVLAGFPIVATHLTPSYSISGGDTVVGYGETSSTDIWAYTFHTNNRTCGDQNTIPTPSGAPCGGTTVSGTMTITLSTGSWVGNWVNPETGVTLSTFTVTGSGGSSILTLPGFIKDVFLRLKLTSSTNVVVANQAAPWVVVSQSYSFNLVASGGTGPYTWSVVSGAWPHGITMTSGGAVSGTPDTVGVWNVTVKATDSLSHVSIGQALVIPVQGALQFIGGNTLSTPVSHAFPYAGGLTGGAPPYTCTLVSGTLLTGTNLNSTCALNGTPTSVGQTATLVLTATDSIGETATETLNVTVDNNGLLLRLARQITQGFNYGLRISNQTGTNAPFTFQLASGTLPTGLIMNCATTGSANCTSNGAMDFYTTGNVSASPGSYPITITSTNSISQVSAAFPISYVVNATPSIGTTTATCIVGNLCYIPVSVTGGSSPFGWQSTSIPSGMLQDPVTGEIYGVPPSVGTYNVTLNMWDANSAPASNTLAITVNSGGSSNTLLNGTWNGTIH